MSDNTDTHSGFTLVEVLIALTVSTILVGVLLTVTFSFYGNTIRNSTEARLAVESQTILRSIVEELRVSSGIRASNIILDINGPAGGWTTDNDSLVLIIAKPVVDINNDYVIDPNTGSPYQNELVYYAVDNRLYKRYLADTAAPGNMFTTSCPPALATGSCPADVVLTEHFQNMSFTFYDQNDTVTASLADAQSIELKIDMLQQSFGQPVDFQNDIRMTMRNAL